jgi:ferritin-like metal-binding protein YciE
MALQLPRSMPTAASIQTWRAGLKDQWQRIRVGFGNAHSIANMDELYQVELRDLCSAERQFCALIDEVWVSIRNESLAQRVSEHAAEVRLRAIDLEELLTQAAAAPVRHSDETMHALVRETSRLAEQCADNVRDAALLGALQRIIHYLIADYGTLAVHARMLGLYTAAATFAQHAERNQDVDAELTALAKVTLNPQPGGASAGAPASP